MNLTQAWKEEAESELRIYWALGDTASVIGGKMGISRSAVLGKAHRLKLDKRGKTGGRKGSPGRFTAAKALTLVEPQSAHRVTFMELERHHCRWPLGGHGERAEWFCGGESVIGPYCLHHHLVAHNRQPVQRTEKHKGLGLWV